MGSMHAGRPSICALPHPSLPPHLIKLLSKAAHHHRGQAVVGEGAAAARQAACKHQPARAHLAGLPELQLAEVEHRFGGMGALSSNIPGL